MSKGALIKENNPNLSAGHFLAEIIKKGIVKGIILQKEMFEGQGVWHYLLKKPEDIEKSKVFVPFMGSSGATILSKFTKDKPSKDPIAIVLRPCEIRGVVELIKYKQVQMDNILLIGIDCGGTYERVNYLDNPSELPDDKTRLRSACKRCLHISPEFGDITLSYFGAENGVWVIPTSEKGEKLIKDMGLTLQEVTPERDNTIKSLVEEHKSEREKQFAEFKEQYDGMEGQLKFFSKCINCKNCMENCPICFCKECFFKSPSLTWDSETYLSMLNSKEAVRMPEDPIFFQWGRLAHITPSCVGCGLCTEACPVNIDVGLIFSYVAEKVQGEFGYEAGRSVEEPPILTEFVEHELEDLAE